MDSATKRKWAGRALGAIPVLMMWMSAGMKFAQPPGLAEGFAHLGLPLSHALGLGLLEVTCTVVYLIPRTRVLGAILMTGFLGGATATHMRIGDPFFLQPLLGAMAWGGLYLRDERLRELLPLVKN
ncbi:MAG: DoxX family protein [Acidobacteria bacterium]|nr:DoxX family protein [Acidobacteriota bacterium]